MNTLNATDLRIGNYIEVSFLQDNGKFKYEMIQVIANTIKDAERYGNEWDARPIPLSEGWLLKAGFEKGKGLYSQWYFIQLLGTEFYLRPNFLGGYLWGFDLEIASGYELNDAQPIQYLHQLQNLWKELSGNELMFKEK